MTSHCTALPLLAPRRFCRRALATWLRRFGLLGALLIAVSAARAQTVHWETGDSGDPSEVQLIFQDCAPDGDPQLPRIDGVTLALAGTSTQTSLTNMSLSRSTILTYRARAQRSGPLQIPAFTVQTNKGSVRVPAFTGGAARTAADANVFSRLEPGSRTLWAGEIFPLTYVLDVSRRAFNQLGTNIEWNPAPLIVEDWSKFEPSEGIVNGEPRLSITSRTRAYAKSPGSVTLNAANQLVNLQSGSIGFGLFQTPRIEQLSVTSDRPVLTVRPLPAGAPAGFNGAVGQFKLSAKVVPTSAGIGEPVTWTVELSGTGNWPEIGGLPQREVSKDFNVVQPQAKRTPSDGKLFDVTLTEDVVLVPTKSGDYTIGPLTFAYFDPSRGEYRSITTAATRVTVTAPVATPAASTPASAADSALQPGATAASRPKVPPAVPPLPGAIPREPLPGSSWSLVPLAESTVITLAVVPFLLLPLFWLWLALRRAKATDPLRPRREAKQRLTATIAEIRAARAARADVSANPGTPSSRLAHLLLRWQHDAAVLWGIAHAAPSPIAFAASSDRSTPQSVAVWQALWSEADRTLYGADAALAPDWCDRADAALAAKPIHGFRAWTALRPRNLLPFVASVALVVASLPIAVAQGTGTNASAAYRRGDFATAEKGWAATVASSPTDAIARHNLSLALAQQDRWGEAAAHAAAAVTQSPSTPALRAQLALACEKAGYVPSSLAGFLPPGPLQALAGNASPGSWQIVLVGSSVLFALALAVLARGIFRRMSPLARRSALGVAVLAAAVGLSATASLLAWGVGSDQRAVIAWRASTLRSIPTEADTTQKTTPLAAGSVALQDEKAFLGWVKLTFVNGQTGWVRKDDVIPLWR